MKALQYIEVSKGVKIGLPTHLTQAEIDKRVSKYKDSLDRSKSHEYNPKIKQFTKSKF